MENSIVIKLDSKTFLKFWGTLIFALFLALTIVVFLYVCRYFLAEYDYARASALLNRNNFAASLAYDKKAESSFSAGLYVQLESQIYLDNLAYDLNQQSSSAKPSSANSTAWQNLLNNAITAANSAVKSYPSDPNGWNNAINVYKQSLSLVSNKDMAMKGVIAALEQLIALEPRNVNLYNQLGNAYLSLSDSSQASSSDKSSYIKAALTSLQDSVQLKSDFPDTFYYLGNVYFYQKDYQNAENNYIKALQLNPYNSYFLYMLAEAYKNQGNNSKALDYLKQASLLDPSNKSIQNEINSLQNK